MSQRLGQRVACVFLSLDILEFDQEWTFAPHALAVRYGLEEAQIWDALDVEGTVDVAEVVQAGLVYERESETCVALRQNGLTH